MELNHDLSEDNHYIERAREIRDLQAERKEADAAALPVTAELHNWTKQFLQNGEDFVVWGEIRNQSGMPRFSDGQMIRTSLISKVEDDLAITLNSVYRLVGEEQGAQA